MPYRIHSGFKIKILPLNVIHNAPPEHYFFFFFFENYLAVLFPFCEACRILLPRAGMEQASCIGTMES